MFVQTNSVSFAQQTTDGRAEQSGEPCQARDIVWARGGGVEVEDGRPVQCSAVGQGFQDLTTNVTARFILIVNRGSQIVVDQLTRSSTTLEI